MIKQITMALIALFLCAYSAMSQEPDVTKPAMSLYRPSGCDTILTHPTDSAFCTCNCVTFNPKWITDATPGAQGLNIENLQKRFDIEIPSDIFQSGRLIGLDSDGPLFSAMFSASLKGNLITTRFTWQYMCRSGAFFYRGVIRKIYPGLGGN
jgi:hypothetical protein